MKCIYCLEDKPQDYFAKTEHVIPQSFGLFEDNFTLNGMVCDECNQYFGDTLEIDLGRDTIEGISRFKYGVKNSKEFKSLGRRSRFKFVIAEGLMKGAFAYLAYSSDLNEVSCKPLPQVGFINKATREYQYFLLEEMPNKAALESLGLDYNEKVRALGTNFEEIQESLARVQISPKYEEELEISGTDTDGKWLIEIEGSIDQTICRAIAKISFNYMAYWHGSDFVLQKAFNPIRFYIRRGEQARAAYVMIRDRSILVDEDPEQKRLVHILTLNWSEDGKAIISQVSLFNHLSYTVQLTKRYRKEKPNLRKGHFFNLGDNRIYELTPLSKMG